MKISVIVPAYNVEKTLPTLLDSLSNQSCKDFEVIVVDDCSKDNTCQVAESYDCTLVRLPRNRGPAYCRNVGTKEARGDIVAFTDALLEYVFTFRDKFNEFTERRKKLANDKDKPK